MKKTLEILKYYRSFYDWSDVNVTLIVSTGRTGTNFLANYFNENQKGVYSVHEPNPDLFDLSVEKFRGNKSILSFQKQLKINRYNQYQKTKEKENKIYLESNGNLSLLLPEVIELFEKPKIIFVTRDINTYIISAYNKSPDSSNQMFLYGKNDHRKRITPFDVNDKINSNKWEHWNRAEKIAWYWAYCNKYILNSLKSYPYYQVKFEDLFGEEKVLEMNKLSKYMGLSDFSDSHIKKQKLSLKRNENSVKLLEEFDNLSDELKDSIVELTNDTRQILGYNK